MTNRFQTASAIAVLAIVAGALVLRVEAAKAPSDLPVTTTIADFGGGYPLRVGSDSLGSYVQTSEVASMIVGTTGDWVLTTYYRNKGNLFTPSNRSVLIDLTEPVTPGNPPPPFSLTNVQSSLMTACTRVGIHLPQIPVGTTALCPGHFRFEAANGLWYRLAMNNDNYPEVNPMKVTCNAADAGGCRNWTLRPSGTTLTGTDPNPKSVAKLLQIDPGTTEAIADLGDYYVSFSITLAR